MRRKAALVGAGLLLVAFGAFTASLVATGATLATSATTVTQATTQSTSITQTTATTSTGPTTPGPGLPSVILPNPKITPGRLNAKVRQSTIKKTICKSGWTKTIRPPVSYTNALKIKQMAQYGETGSPSEYEEDHFIPLSSVAHPGIPRTSGRSRTPSQSCRTRSRLS